MPIWLGHKIQLISFDPICEKYCLIFFEIEMSFEHLYDWFYADMSRTRQWIVGTLCKRSFVIFFEVNGLWIFFVIQNNINILSSTRSSYSQFNHMNKTWVTHGDKMETNVTQLLQNFNYLVTISGAYLCPVGTIWPLFTVMLSQSSQMNICRYTSLMWRRCGRTSQNQRWRQKTSDSLSFLRGRVASLSTFTTSPGELKFHNNMFCNGLQKNDESS